ncbi:MAG: DUF1989 domain-containing protein [Stappiaceae bacterium]
MRCGCAQKVSLCTGDIIQLKNQDGGSAVVLAAFDGSGRNALASLGLGHIAMIPEMPEGVDVREMLAWIRSNGGAPSEVSHGALFDRNTAPGEEITLAVSAECDLWVIVPFRSNMIASGGGGTCIIERVRSGKGIPELPDPIGEIRDEFRVGRATAHAYEVQKGDYVQVIDVEGRQCSDFMAMRSGALEKGMERYIDSAVTRTMVGGAYPGPGLYDKFFDQDMQPLLEVVQDTVGRHDTFALACTARGYEDRGFPGHVNCSDNISNVYDSYGVQRRSAWPAINFFFNSWILPTDNRIQIDEAWSRPGDFVALKALTDLVCVSTACPDDIDPINGWNPTDIHVRIYRPDKPLRYAVAHRPFAESEPIMTRESAFHARTSGLTSGFAPARDVWLPAHYDATGVIGEYWACRNDVTIQDMSSLRKFDVMGPDAEKLLQLCLTRDVSKLAVHRGHYALMLSDTGSVIDDGTLFRLAPDLFRWCCGSDGSGRQLRDIAEQNGLKVWVKAMWSSLPNLAVQGPNSRELLRRIVFTHPSNPSIDTMKWFGCTIARLHDRNGPAFMLTRSGFTGDLGYEIFCDVGSAVQIWDAVMKAGEDLGIVAMGGRALELLRVEAGLMVAGAEFTPGVDAFEAGLGFAVNMKKEGFIGREALDRNQEAPRNVLVGLAFESTECPSHGDPIYQGQHQVGAVTSAVRSPMLGHAIALARIAIEHSELNTKLEVGRLDGQIKRLPAEVCEQPFFDPKRERARA